MAIDIAQAAIEELHKNHSQPNLKFLVHDFTNLTSPISKDLPAQFGIIYSRFTLHAISKAASSRSLKWAFENLKNGGYLLIEVRSVKDKLFGVGTPVEGEPDAYISTHYRRFVRREQIEQELKDLGFSIENIIEQDNLAVYKDDNPVVIRIHARKP